MWDQAADRWVSGELGRIPTPFPKDDVHVRAVKLAESCPVLPALRRFLSPEEKVRHDRFHSRHDRDQFALGRGGLRVLLARYCRSSPAEVPLRLTPEGKPVLPAGTNPDGWMFNVAHADGLVVWAFARDRLVGIDTEPVRPLAEEAGVVADYFTPAEVEAYRALPEGERTRGFLRAWTRKEAVLKAAGVGLTEGLAHFVVSLGPDEPACVLRGEPGGIDASRWSLHDLKIDPGHITALAVLGSDVRILFG